MKKITIIALLGCSAFLLVNNTNKYNKKLDKIISNQEVISLKTNELKIDSLQLEIMDLGARLDSCIIVND
jgi:cellobiose-specific phosphotransferase system component IIB